MSFAKGNGTNATRGGGGACFRFSAPPKATARSCLLRFSDSHVCGGDIRLSVPTNGCPSPSAKSVGSTCTWRTAATAPLWGWGGGGGGSSPPKGASGQPFVTQGTDLRSPQLPKAPKVHAREILCMAAMVGVSFSVSARAGVWVRVRAGSSSRGYTTNFRGLVSDVFCQQR